MAEEWVKEAWNKAKVEANLHAKADKKLRAAVQQNKELTKSVTISEGDHLSAKAGLKNVET